MTPRTQWFHIVFILVCLAVMAARFIPHLAHVSSEMPHKSAEPSESISHTTSPRFTPTSATHAVASTPSVSSPTNSESQAPLLLDLDALDFESTLPPSHFAERLVADLDARAKTLVDNNDDAGLINLKLEVVGRLADDDRICFLMADSASNYLEFLKSSDDDTAQYLRRQCVASLEAIKALSPTHPYPYTLEAILALRGDGNPSRACDIAEKGLRLMNDAQAAKGTENVYFWRLTQIVAIVNSCNGDSSKAISAVDAFEAYLTKQPQENRGLLREVLLVGSYLQKGHVLRHAVDDGQIKP